MKTLTRSILATLVVALTLATASAQQPNSPAASMVVNNQAGTGSLIQANIDSPGVAVVEISSEPGMPYCLLVGTFAPGWFNLAGAGIVDLDTSTITAPVNGFALAKPLDYFAKTDADSGKAFLAASFGPGITGAGPGLQAILLDPAALLGVTFTAASQLNFAAPGGAPGSASSFGSSGSGSGPGNLSASGMIGSSGALLAEVRAPIDAIGTSDVTILQNVTVQVNASTNVRSLGGSSIPFSSLVVGDYVKVELFADPMSGQFIAHQIRLETPSFGWQVKVEGVVDAATLADVTMLGVLFNVVPSSDVDLNLANLMPGDFVEIKANANTTVPGTYDIVEIHGINPFFAFDVAFKSRSYVDAIGTNTITVLGVTINVGTGVRFDNIGSLAQLSTSSYVEVRANPDASGQLWASRIKLRSPDNEVRLDGPVEMLMNPDFSIWGVTIQTNGGTSWQNGLSGFGDLAVGLRVEAKGNLVGGAIVATEVEIDDD